jgi:hypothetical protein
MRKVAGGLDRVGIWEEREIIATCGEWVTSISIIYSGERSLAHRRSGPKSKQANSYHRKGTIRCNKN